MTTSSETIGDTLAIDGVTHILPRFADDEALDELRVFFESALKDHPVHPLYGCYALRDWHLVLEPLRRLLTAPELVNSLVAATGAKSLLLWRSKLFEKLPGDGPVDWHQDYGYFDGEEVGGHRPALYPFGAASPWTWTVWLALTNVTLDDGVLEMVLGSQDRRYATRMVPLTKSGAFAYIDPVNRVTGKNELLERAKNSSLILDVDTRDVYKGLEVENMSLEALLSILTEYLDLQRAVVTEPFDVSLSRTQQYPMNAGEYIIFDQRTMHRSLAAGKSSQLRLAISARYAVGTTLVYPQRTMRDSLDGSNLDIREHRCIRVFGSEFNEDNAYTEP